MKIKKVYLGEKQIYPERNIITYDFQNDGQLGFTRERVGTGSGNAGYTSGQGCYWSSNNAVSHLLKNSNIYNGKKLLGVKFNVYFGGNKYAIGLCASNNGNAGLFIRYKEESNSTGIAIKNGSTLYARDNSVGVHTGEIEIVINFETNKAYGTINGTSFELDSSYVEQFITAWDNHTLHIMADSWGSSTTSYIRRVEFITK